MWTRISQSDDPENCFFANPTLESGEELPLGVFAHGEQLRFDRLRVQPICPGKIAPVSLSMDVTPILNDDAANLFCKELGDGLQLIPCATHTGQSLWVGNILDVVDCLDRSQTRAEYYSNNYPLKHLRGCVKCAFELVLDPRKIDGRKLFRVRGNELPLIATEEFLQRLTEAGIFGLRATDFPRYRTHDCIK